MNDDERLALAIVRARATDVPDPVGGSLTCEYCGGVLTYATKQVHDLEARLVERELQLVDTIMRDDLAASRARIAELEAERDRLKAALDGVLDYFDKAGRVHESWPDARRVLDDARLALGLMILVDGVWTDGKPLREEEQP